MAGIEEELERLVTVDPQWQLVLDQYRAGKAQLPSSFQPREPKQ